MCEELGTAQLVVREAQDKSGLFDYFICGVRKGYKKHKVVRVKGSRPERSGAPPEALG